MRSTPEETAYHLAARGGHLLARLATPLLARSSSKLARGLRGRRGAVDRLVEWGRRAREVDRPLVWFHAPSVGEGLQARAVLESLAAIRPDAQTLFTHFSPSAEGLAGRMPADAADYLPWDVPAELRPVLDAVRPTLVAFTKTEVWPALVREAGRRGGDSVLIAATLPAGSSRLRWPAGEVLRPAVSRLAAVMAIAPEDARRFESLGADPGRTVVTGDPAVDSAAERLAAADPAAPHIRVFAGVERPTLVAGSTWPADERVLLPALTALRERRPGLRVVVAPHEPSPVHLEPLLDRLRAGGWSTATLGQVEQVGSAEGVDAVVVDRIGVLAHLYAVGSVAFVGGGFHDLGLHSVLEPAAAGSAILFGPGYGGSRSASDLLEVGGARVVRDADEVERTVDRWLGDPTDRDAAGRAARGYVDRHRGAAGETAERLARLLH